MLIDLTLRVTINPAEYVGTLVVRLDTGNQPGTGIVAGRHDSFEREEENQPAPRLRANCMAENDPLYDNLGIFDFVIDRPVAKAREHQVLRYRYVATAHGNGVYFDYPDVWVLTLSEMTEGWHVAFGRPSENGLDLVLPDYRPGWLASRPPGVLF